MPNLVQCSNSNSVTYANAAHVLYLFFPLQLQQVLIDNDILSTNICNNHVMISRPLNLSLHFFSPLQRFLIFLDLYQDKKGEPPIPFYLNTVGHIHIIFLNATPHPAFTPSVFSCI